MQKRTLKMSYRIEFPACTLQVIADKIVHADFTGGEIALSDMIQLYDEVEKIGNGERIGMLSTFKNYVPPKDEVMKYIASERPAKLMFASAIIVQSVAMKLVMNLYMRFFNKQTLQRKIFTDKVNAIAWLKKMQMEEKER